MNDEPLGRHLNIYATTLRTTSFTPSLWKMLAHDIAIEIGMFPIDKPASWLYPMDGKGGTGYTIVQPITESFIAIDTWSDFGGAYLIICSCRAFDVAKLNHFLGERIGLKLGESVEKFLELKA